MHRSIQESQPPEEPASITRETAKGIGRPAPKPMQNEHSVDELAKSLEWMSDIKGLV
jgi:hypothetical protein